MYLVLLLSLQICFAKPIFSQLVPIASKCGCFNVPVVADRPISSPNNINCGCLALRDNFPFGNQYVSRISNDMLLHKILGSNQLNNMALTNRLTNQYNPNFPLYKNIHLASRIRRRPNNWLNLKSRYSDIAALLLKQLNLRNLPVNTANNLAINNNMLPMNMAVTRQQRYIKPCNYLNNIVQSLI